MGLALRAHGAKGMKTEARSLPIVDDEQRSDRGASGRIMSRALKAIEKSIHGRRGNLYSW